MINNLSNVKIATLQGIPLNRFGIRQKEHNTNKKFVCRFLIRNVPHFYGLPLDLCGKRIAALFAKRTTIFANAPQFGKTHRVFMGKAPQSSEKRQSAAHTEG